MWSATRKIGLLATLLTSFTARSHATEGAAPRPRINPQIHGPKGPGTYPAILRQLDGVGSQTVEPTDAPATKSLEELRGGLSAWHARIENLMVDFHFRQDRKIEPRVDSSLFQIVPPNYSFDLKAAVKGLKQYSRYTETTGGRKKFPNIIAFDGTVARAFQPSRLTGSIAAARDPNAPHLLEHYTSALPIIVKPADAKDKTAFDYPPAGLARPDFFSVASKLERVDGFACHVLESVGGDLTYWIDPDHGYVIRRIAWIGGRSADFRFVHQLTTMADFVDAGAGVFLPKRVRRIRFAGLVEPDDLVGMIAQSDEIDVEAIVVNTVPDSLFDLKFPPATAVIDKTRDRYYFVPGGDESLDEAIAHGARIVNGELVGLESMRGPDVVHFIRNRQDRFRTLLILVNLALIVAGGGVMIFSRRGIRRGAGPAEGEAAGGVA